MLLLRQEMEMNWEGQNREIESTIQRLRQLKQDRSCCKTEQEQKTNRMKTRLSLLKQLQTKDLTSQTNRKVHMRLSANLSNDSENSMFKMSKE